MESLFDSTSKTGTASGTLVILFVNIHSADIVRTVVLAAFGAAVSFVVTLFLKFLVRWIRHRN